MTREKAWMLSSQKMTTARAHFGRSWTFGSNQSSAGCRTEEISKDEEFAECDGRGLGRGLEPSLCAWKG